MLLKIGDLDVTQWLTSFEVEYEVLLSEKGTGRNARGNTVIDIVNRKDKLICTFGPMMGDELKAFLAAIEDYVLDITFQNPKTQEEKNIQAYIGTPKVGVLLSGGTLTVMKGFSLNFIEL